MEQWSKDDDKAPSTPRKTRPSATLSTTNPTWTGLEPKPGLHRDRPATTSAMAQPTSLAFSRVPAGTVLLIK
jgi:hypothetical protein